MLLHLQEGEKKKRGNMASGVSGDNFVWSAGLLCEFAARRESHMYKQTSGKTEALLENQQQNCIGFKKLLRGRKRDGKSTGIIPLPDERLSFSRNTAMRTYSYFFVVSFMIKSYFSREAEVYVCAVVCVCVRDGGCISNETGGWRVYKTHED